MAQCVITDACMQRHLFFALPLAPLGRAATHGPREEPPGDDTGAAHATSEAASSFVARSPGRTGWHVGSPRRPGGGDPAVRPAKPPAAPRQPDPVDVAVAKALMDAIRRSQGEPA